MRTATGMGPGLILVLLLAGGPLQAQKEKKAKDVVVAGKSITQWIKALESKGAPPRIQAINALIQAGPEARLAVPALITVFRDKDATFMHPLAAVALSRIGPDAVPGLQKALTDGAAAVRSGAALSLGLIGPGSRPAVGALTTALKDREPLVRTAVAQALGRIGSLARPAVPRLRDALKDKDVSVRVEAAAALWKIQAEPSGVAVLGAALAGNDELAEHAAALLAEIGPPAKTAIGQLKAALKAKSVRLRVFAAVACYRVARDLDSALPVLESLLTAKQASDRLQAVWALGSLGAEEKAVTLLAGLLKSKDADTRREAACALAERGVVLENAVSALEAGLDDLDAGVRWWCALALAASDVAIRKQEEDILRIFRAAIQVGGDRAGMQDVQGPGNARSTAALARVLTNRPDRLRVEAARSLAQLGVDARPAQGALVEALKTDNKALRRAAADALGQMGGEALPLLMRMLGNEDYRVREGAARALAQMGVSARSALPALQRVKKDGASTVRTQVALALWRFAQEDMDSLRALKLVLVDVDNKDRWEAIEAMGIISVEARPPIRGLTEAVVTALKDRDALVRTHAAKWIFRRERQARVVVPLLREGVTDRDVLVRISSVEVLGELGAAARVVPLLTTALEDRDVLVRLSAEEALARGGAEAVPQLLEALKSKSAKVRLGVVHALTLIGPPAKEAISALQELKSDKDAAVRKAAVLALHAIKPSGRK